MTHTLCKGCRRLVEGECDCTTAKLPAVARPSEWIDEARNVCLKCPHWKSEVDRPPGCSLIPKVEPKHKPCDIGYFLAKGRECFDDPPRFKSRSEHEESLAASDSHSYRWLAGPWISYEQLRADVAEFSSKISTMGFTAIAGVPRSGLMVASELAVRLGLPLYTFTEDTLVKLNAGLRLRGQEAFSDRILVMEDSTASGTSIKEVKGWLGDRPDVSFGAIYATTNGAKGIDVYHKILELPHWFEWNLLGNPNLARAFTIGTDFDGILCPDFTAEEWDDGPKYIKRMKEMPCIRNPGVSELRYIITARGERYRKETEQWLKTNRIKFGKLIMGPWKTKAEQDASDIGVWKAEQCKRLNINIFVESEPVQAQRIAELCPGVVAICPARGRAYVQ